MKSNINNILILAGDTEGNLGDRAILQSTCTELLSINPDLQISIMSKHTNPLLNMKGIQAIEPGISGFFSLIQTARKTDLILCGGGGLFQDDDSLIKMPYWALRLLLIRLFCNNIVGYSLGVGPLSASSSRIFARLAFSCMQQVSARDPIAQKTAQHLTSKIVALVPDPALLLEPASDELANNQLQAQNIDNNKPLIGVAVRRWFPAKARIIPNKISAKFRSKNKSAVKQSEHLCSLLAKVLDQLVIEHDAQIVFMPSYNVAHESDDELCDEILKRMKTGTGKTPKIDTPHLYKAISSKLSVLLCGRMHPSIFAAASGTPVVGLAYNPKFHGFFSLLDLDNYVMNVDDFVSQNLTNELTELTSKALINKQNTTEQLVRLKNDIRAFNRLILGLTTEMATETTPEIVPESLPDAQPIARQPVVIQARGVQQIAQPVTASMTSPDAIPEAWPEALPERQKPSKAGTKF